MSIVHPQYVKGNFLGLFLMRPRCEMNPVSSHIQNYKITWNAFSLLAATRSRQHAQSLILAFQHTCKQVLVNAPSLPDHLHSAHNHSTCRAMARSLTGTNGTACKSRSSSLLIVIVATCPSMSWHRDIYHHNGNLSAGELVTAETLVMMCHGGPRAMALHCVLAWQAASLVPPWDASFKCSGPRQAASTAFTCTSVSTHLILACASVRLFASSFYAYCVSHSAILSSFSKNEQYEWFQSYDGFRHLLTSKMLSPANGVSTSNPRRTIEVRDRDGNMVPRSIVCPDDTPRLAPTKFPPRDQCRALIVGCGNSGVGEAMMKDGWTGGIVNVDFSDVVIEQMKERYNEAFYEQLKKSYKNVTGSHLVEIQPMEFRCADVTTELPFEDGSFDLIVCKGTLDAILCSAGSTASAKRMMQECCRLLRDQHGAFVVVTHASPDNRLVFFENEGDEWWAGLNVHKLSKERSALDVHFHDTG